MIATRDTAIPTPSRSRSSRRALQRDTRYEGGFTLGVFDAECVELGLSNA